MLERLGYGRFGLVRNPFQDVASETLTDAEALHSPQDLDRFLEDIKGHVLDRTRKAVLGLSGPMGSGKTHRLRLAESEAARLGAFCVLRSVVADAPSQVGALAREVRLSHAKRPLFPPAWLRRLRAVERKGARSDPEEAGAALAEALNANAPAFLLLNDAQNLLPGADLRQTLQTLHALVNRLQPGVLVLVAGHPQFFAETARRDAALMSRFDRVLPIGPMSDAEAQDMLARRLPAHRAVEDLDPLYPFTPAAAHELNRAAGGNPRTLLKLADLVLGLAASQRGFQIVPETVREAVRTQSASEGRAAPPAVPPAAPTAPPAPAARPAAPPARAASRAAPPATLARPAAPPAVARHPAPAQRSRGGAEDKQPNGHL